MQIMRQVLAQAVSDERIAHNPALHVKLPGARGKSTTAVVDDPNQFLTAAQVSNLVDATPWPYNVMVHLAAWAGLRAGELCGLQVGDLQLPVNRTNRLGKLRVERTVVLVNGALAYQEPKTQGSSRKVPLTASTTALVRDYLAAHPRSDDPSAPLIPALRPGSTPAGPDLDWAQPLRHTVFYPLVFKPAVERAGLNTAVVFHSLRHTYVSLCVAAGIPALEISRFAGHSSVTTTLGIYAHLFESDHSAAMTALGAMGQPATGNVVPLRGRAVGTE